MSTIKFIRMLFRILLYGSLAILFLAAQSRARAQETRYEFAELHMGMEVRVVLYAGDATLARQAARAAYARVAMLEDIMSDYRDESEIRRLGNRPGEWVPVSPELFAVLRLGREVAERSGGAFDPTVGPYVALWREARQAGRLPEAEALARARQSAGWQKLQVDTARGWVRLDTSGMLLDLGGIAKGYILDQARVELGRLGVGRVLLVAGGDIVAGDPPPGEAGWRVAAEGAGSALKARAARLANAAMSTSGASEQFVEIGGVRYSHVVDPRTGMALTDGRRAYVIADDGALADALATALTVMGDAESRRLMGWYPDVIAEVTR